MNLASFGGNCCDGDLRVVAQFEILLPFDAVIPKPRAFTSGARDLARSDQAAREIRRLNRDNTQTEPPRVFAPAFLCETVKVKVRGAPRELGS